MRVRSQQLSLARKSDGGRRWPSKGKKGKKKTGKDLTVGGLGRGILSKKWYGQVVYGNAGRERVKGREARIIVGVGKG